MKLTVRRYVEGGFRRRSDLVADEEPLEIRIQGRAVAVTMRTPGHDFELAAGFLYGESVLTDPGQVQRIAYCAEPQNYNVVNLELKSGHEVDFARLSRHVYTTSSCGVCGKASLDLVEQACPRRPIGSAVRLDPAFLTGLPARLRQAQSLFERTGGLHGSGLFDAGGSLLDAREDVGRHNALDKVVGARFLAGKLPADDCVLLLSGRASFELLQKAVLAGIPVVASVGAPSSLAVEVARRYGVTLVGFLSDRRFNVYSGEERLSSSSQE
ncbi:MAG: formate dehydrogenase accessory sulfurtransferase FdhD [Candidatus Eremiobacterota bacterium]